MLIRNDNKSLFLPFKKIDVGGVSISWHWNNLVFTVIAVFPEEIDGLSGLVELLVVESGADCITVLASESHLLDYVQSFNCCHWVWENVNIVHGFRLH